MTHDERAERAYRNLLQRNEGSDWDRIVPEAIGDILCLCEQYGIDFDAELDAQRKLLRAGVGDA